MIIRRSNADAGNREALHRISVDAV